MSYNDDIAEVRQKLLAELETAEELSSILRSKELRSLYGKIKDLPAEERGEFGQAVNSLKNELEAKITEIESAKKNQSLPSIDVTAPFDVNVPASKKPRLLRAENGSTHPITQELNKILDIFARMGFSAIESRQLDDEYHMFTSLNFPENHPARDDYDTFITTDGLVAPAHTSVMQTRILRENKLQLEKNEPIAYVIPGRVFRNEDVDARHEHTFHQIEGVYTGEGITVGDLIGTLKSFLETYYERELSVRVNPFYFPFTEPSFEFMMSCPFCESGCKVCSYESWIEILGCGMIHPNVLDEAGVDSKKYTGFAWGMGLDRLVMMKNNIEDVRHFHSGKLDFLKQFGGAK